MKIGCNIRHKEVRLYVQDEHDRRLATIIRFGNKKMMHIGEYGEHLLFTLPQDREWLFQALRTFLGPNRGRYVFEQLMEKLK